MDRRPCWAQDRQGQACRGWALPSGWCWMHDPERADERRAACAKGGRLKAIAGHRRKLSTPSAVVDFLSGLAHDLAEGRKDAETARAIAYVLMVQLKALELSEQSEVRRLLAEVERLTQQARRGSLA